MHELKTFFIHNGLLYRYASDHSKDFCTLVIPKAWRYTILVGTHDKMGHQGNNRTYSLIKQQYYWKGMAKDVKDYIQRCPACQQEKARVQSYPLHMTEIPDRPFDKIAMDLATDFTKSNKGNKHILTIIDLLTGWPEVIPISNKSANTITKAFIRHYLPRHLCPRFILSDNGMEFKNQIFDKVTKDLGIERIFSAPYHPQSNGKLETFHKFLKPTLKKMCAEDQDNWDDYIEQVSGTYRSSKPRNRRITILFGLWKRWKPTTPPTTPTTHQIPMRSRFRITMPRPTSTIIVHSQEIFGRLQIPHCRKDDRQNRTRIQSWRYTSRTKPQENGTSNGEQDTESSRLSAKDVTCTLKTKPQERSDPVMLRTLSFNQSMNYGM